MLPPQTCKDGLQWGERQYSQSSSPKKVPDFFEVVWQCIPFIAQPLIICSVWSFLLQHPYPLGNLCRQYNSPWLLQILSLQTNLQIFLGEYKTYQFHVHVSCVYYETCMELVIIPSTVNSWLTNKPRTSRESINNFMIIFPVCKLNKTCTINKTYTNLHKRMEPQWKVPSLLRILSLQTDKRLVGEHMVTFPVVH